VSYVAIDDTAVNGTDYTAAAGSVTFLANETAKTVSIPVINRAGAQGSRRFFLVLCDGVVCGPPSTAPLLAPTQTAVTIVDKDAEQTVQFNAASYSVSEATAAATITLQRLGTPTGTLTVNFATADNTAVAPVDYQAVNTTVTFAAGVRTRTVTVPLRNNAQVEGDRTLTLTLSNMQLDGVPATGITCGGATGATCTVPLLILDDDVVGEVQFSAVTYQMAESAPSATITLLRSGGTAGGGSVEVVVDPPVVGRVGAPTPNPIVFGPGVTSRLVTIPIVPNTLVEGNIDVRLRLVNPQNGLVVGTRDIATLTIVEDDVAGAVQFAQAAYSVPEPPGPAGTTTTVMITLTRSGGTASGVTVDFATADPGPCPPPPGASYACAGTNYVATRGTLTFAAGQTSQTFPVVVMADALPTGSIPLTLTLSNPSSRATLGSRATAALTIVDVQAAVGFIAGAYAVAEGGSAVVTVERTGAAGLPGVVVVHYATSDGTATSLGATPDYRATAGNLTFNPGVRTLSFSVATVGNVRQEGNRAFNVTLTPVSLGATTLVRSAATVTILDNDVAGVVAFVNGAVKAPSEFGAVNLLLHRPASGTAGPVTVDYRTVDGTAKANIDYVPVARTLTFGAGITDLTISVTILGNTRDDGNRAFTIELSSPTGGLALGTPSTASVLITDDDVAGTVQLSVASMTAATTCTVAPCKAAVTVKRFGGMASGVTVDWATVDGTGNAVNDYVPDTGTLSFGVSEFVKTIVVELRPGATVGSNFGVVLSHPQGGAKLGTVTTTTVTLR
jgi:hypothetical protein